MNIRKSLRDVRLGAALSRKNENGGAVRACYRLPGVCWDRIRAVSEVADIQSDKRPENRERSCSSDFTIANKIPKPH